MGQRDTTVAHSRDAEPSPHPSAGRRSVPQLVSTWARETPDAPALSFGTETLSYADLDAASLVAARRLLAAGVDAGSQVGILLREGSAAYFTHALGTMRLGATSVTINARNKVRELNFVLRHAGISVLLTGEEFRGLLSETDIPEGCRIVFVGADPDFVAGAETVAPEAVHALEAAVQPDDRALMMYTSGTTADPKGCLHSHATLLAEGENCAEALSVSAADRYWTPLPLFHIGGWQVLMTTLARGACFSHPGTFEATTALDQLERERVTIAFPAFELIWNQVLGHPRFPDADLSAIRIVQNVGAPERLAQMQAMMPQASQISSFGLTESCGSICLGDPEHDSLYARTHTSGHPLRGVELRVVDPDTGAECGPGTPGELHFRGPTRFVGYHSDPQATAAAIDADGWCATGDVMCWQEDGTITFVGRMKDILKVGGENVSAADIEGYLVTHPAIGVASVIGVRDARYGEVPAAFVQLSAGQPVSEEEVIAFCVGHIAGYKVPRYVRIVDTFPVTASLKIQKFVLRERLEAELDRLGISEAPPARTP